MLYTIYCKKLPDMIKKLEMLSRSWLDPEIIREVWGLPTWFSGCQQQQVVSIILFLTQDAPILRQLKSFTTLRSERGTAPTTTPAAVGSVQTACCHQVGCANLVNSSAPACHPCPTASSRLAFAAAQPASFQPKSFLWLNLHSIKKEKDHPKPRSQLLDTLAMTVTQPPAQSTSLGVSKLTEISSSSLEHLELKLFFLMEWLSLAIFCQRCLESVRKKDVMMVMCIYTA